MKRTLVLAVIVTLAGCGAGFEPAGVVSSALTSDEAVTAVIVACAGQHLNHGQCVKCAVETLDALKKTGQIAASDKGRLVAQFAQSCQNGCLPTTCAVIGDNCGSLSDGCGGALACGTCTAPMTCGGGGTPNVCGQAIGVGCASGVRAGFTDVAAYPTIAACAGSFQGDYVFGAPAAAICASGWHVCRGDDSIVHTITFEQATGFGGCFAYNAHNDCNGCYRTCDELPYSTLPPPGGPSCYVSNYQSDSDMSGMGASCTRWADGSSSNASCTATGRTDASTNSFGCGWSNSLAGVICCANADPLLP